MNIKWVACLLLTLTAAFLARAETAVRFVAIKGDLTVLTDSEREWLRGFKTAASKHLREDAAADALATWLETAANGARRAALRRTANYLTVASRVLHGTATIEDAESAFRETVNEQLLVVLRFDGSRVVDLVISTCNATETREVENSLERFERNLPGFVPDWLDKSETRAITRIAELHFRAGRNANTIPTGTYLPFERTLIPKIGRTWIIYANAIRANWWAEGLRPVALRVLPDAANRFTAESVISWYGHRLPLYDAGPNLKAAERDRLGSSQDPISIMKGDLLPVLLAKENDAAVITLITASFGVLRDVSQGSAPEAHRPAATTELNWIAAHGGLRFDAASVTWRIDHARARKAIAELADMILAIERDGDAKRAADLLSHYGGSTTELDSTIAAIRQLPSVKVQPVFVN